MFRRRIALRTLLAAATVLVVSGLTIPAGASRPVGGIAHRTNDPRTTSLDVRTREPGVPVGPRTGRARVALASRLGSQGVLESDPKTGTIRFLARRDGYLTRSSDRAPALIALDYVRAHLPAFGLTAADLGSLTLARDYVDILGTHHLIWAQRLNGVPLFDDDLRAAVTKSGRLLMVGGSPVHALGATTVPWVSATAADASVRRSVKATGPTAVASASTLARRETTFTGGDTASLVLFRTSGGTRLAWQVTANAAPDARYRAVVDARTGSLLWRTNMVQFDDVTGSGLGWDYYPSDLVPDGGGSQHPITFPVESATKLKGNNAWVMKNLNGFYRVRRSSQIPANGPGPSWTFPASLDTTTTTENCTTHWACTWNSHVPYSWQANVEQNAVQLYSYLNTYHDHLQAAPIGFTEAAGNFQQVNSSGQGAGGDPVVGWSDTCADGGNGFPCFTFNAFMYTPPDGYPPEASMLLFDPASGASLGNPNVPAGNAGDDASVVYHEYTHGLSNRLVVDAQGFSTLYTYQAYSMGEGWSDWYALDFLAAQGFQVDTPAPGEVSTGYYIQGGQPQPVRTEPMDCPVGSSDPSCPGGGTGHTGGYTYGDMCHIEYVFGEGCEPHADSEIWSQTLWDLRTALGSAKAEALVTRAMELSPAGPSYLDMRDAIFLADRVAFGAADDDTLWTVFAARGMGFWADTIGGNDFTPTEDFSLPPTCPAECGALSGTVTDAETGAPISGAVVTLHPGIYSTTTDQTGAYRIRNIGLHEYRQIDITHLGFEPVSVGPVNITGAAVLDGALHADWAAAVRGGSIADFNGGNFGFLCGPDALIDLDRTLGWITRAPIHPHSGHFAEIALPKRIDVSSFGLDPGPTCGNNRDQLALGHFAIFTSRDGDHWTLAFERRRPLPTGTMRTLVPDRGTNAVRYVKLVVYSARGKNAYHVEVAELTVRGTPA